MRESILEKLHNLPRNISFYTSDLKKRKCIFVKKEIMTKNYLVILPLLILICFGCKKEIPVGSGLELSATTESNTVILNWTPVMLSGFKSINIYRSVSPIPAPLFNKPIDGTLLIGTITDKTITTFKDSSVVLGSSGVVYYKIVLNLADRVIPSNEEQVSLDGFSILYNSVGFASSSAITPFPEKNLLYITNNNSTISVVDYSQRKIITTASLSQWGNLYPVMNAGNAELFMMTSSMSVSCYDAITLMAKYSITLPSSGGIRDFKVKDNYMYVLYMYNYYTAKIRTYDLSTQTMVNERTVYNFGSSQTTCNLFIGTQSNTLIFKYSTQTYNNQLGYYVYKNVCKKYNILNHLPADSMVISPPLMSPDSLNGSNNNYYYILPSADGNYLTCNTNGDVISMSDNSLHSVRTGNNLNPMVVYSNTGNYLLGKPNNNNTGGITFNLIDVFSLPNFNLVMSLKSPNPAFPQNSSSMSKDDFLDNDSLVSYNLKHTFTNNQTASALTVFFKKIN